MRRIDTGVNHVASACDQTPRRAANARRKQSVRRTLQVLHILRTQGHFLRLDSGLRLVCIVPKQGLKLDNCMFLASFLFSQKQSHAKRPKLKILVRNLTLFTQEKQRWSVNCCISLVNKPLLASHAWKP